MDIQSSVSGFIVGSIATIIIFPIVKNIICKFLESKIDEKTAKILSIYNAQNDAKIHISKSLFELEQKAIEDMLKTIYTLDTKVAKLSGHVLADISLNTFDKFRYIDITGEMCKTFEDFNTDVNSKSIYVDEKIFHRISHRLKIYINMFPVINQYIDSYDINNLNKYLEEIVQYSEKDNQEINKMIRSYYNSIKII